MPTDDDRNANDEGQHEEVPAGATPTFSLEQLGEVVDRAVSRALEATRADRTPQRPAPMMEPEPEGATDEEWENTPRLAAAKDQAKALWGLKQEMATFRQFGLDRLGTITTELEGNKLPHFNEFRNEISAELQKLDPVARTNPVTIKLVHDTVTMRHYDDLMAKARDEGARQARVEAPTPGNTTGRGRQEAPSVPTMEDIGLSEENIEDIMHRGGPDEFARRVSNGRHANWAEWVAARDRMNTAPKTTKGRVITFVKRLPPEAKGGQSG